MRGLVLGRARSTPSRVDASSSAASLAVFLFAVTGLLLAAAGAAAQGAGPGGTGAQTAGQAANSGPPFGVSVRAGFSHPKGDLGDLADDGWLLGLALGWRVSPRVTVLVEGSLEDLEPGGRILPDAPPLGGVLGPNVELWRVMAMASVELTDPAISRWEVAVQAGAGGTGVAADAFANGDAFTTVEPTLMAGLLAGYDVTRRLTLFARGGGSIWFDGTGPGENYLGKEVTFTQSAGVRVRF